MDIVAKNCSLRMKRDHMTDLPAYALPAAYACRWYRPGDERQWVGLQSRADLYNAIDLDLYEGQFGLDAGRLAARQAFLIAPDGEVVGTASAWFDEPDETLGRLHWVAIVPEYQGLGLAKPLLSLVCARLAALGHRRACLTTSSARVPALNLYLKFGFVPEIRHDDDRRAWSELAAVLRERMLLEDV